MYSVPSPSYFAQGPYIQRASTGFQLSDRHFCVILFGGRWNRVTILPIFLTLWILVVFAGSGCGYFDDQSANKTRKKLKSLRFDLLKIKMYFGICRWHSKPWRLVLRCLCFTRKYHKVVSKDDRKIFDPVKQVSSVRAVQGISHRNKVFTQTLPNNYLLVASK